MQMDVGPTRIRWDPRRAGVRASAGGSLMQMDVGPTRIRADPVGSAESGGASQRWGCTVLAMQKNAWL